MAKNINGKYRKDIINIKDLHIVGTSINHARYNARRKAYLIMRCPRIFVIDGNDYLIIQEIYDYKGELRYSIQYYENGKLINHNIKFLDKLLQKVS